MLNIIVILTFSFGIFQGSNGSSGPSLYQVTEPFTHAECPTWDGRNNLLYFVDVVVGKIYSYNYTDRALTSVTVNGAVSPVVPSKADPNLLIVGLDRTITAVQWDRESGTATTKTLATVADDTPDSNMNDGKADKQGRIWFGTTIQDGDIANHPNRGHLFRVSRDTVSSPEIVISPVNVSNGMAWNKANDKFYYIDSPTFQIAQYDYNDETGEISNRSVAFDFIEQVVYGIPDGMTIDEDDNLWVALFATASVVKINPTTGKLLDLFPMPTEEVTSVMWGGPDLDILFITTSRIYLTPTQILQQPQAGCVFAMTNLGTKGVPVFEADIIDSI